MIYVSILKKSVIYEYRRKRFIKDAIANIGEIIEKENSITCIVKQDLLDKVATPNSYELYLFGISSIFNASKKSIDYYKLDKPVHYIFDGITFYVPIQIFSHFCDITFINCTFSHSYFKIFHADKITFAGNKFHDGFSTLNDGAFLRTTPSGKIGKLYFKNEHFINEYLLKEYGENNFGININADEVHISHSTIITDDKNGQFNIKGKNIKIEESIMNSPKTYIDAIEIDMDRKSKLKSEKGIIIGNDDSNCNIDICIDDIYSPYIVLNDVEWVNYKNGNTSFYHDDPIDVQKKKNRTITNP